MNRYEVMASIPPGAKMEFKEVVRLFLQFVEECDFESMHYQNCPAVMLLGRQIAFHCHADVQSVDMNHKLLKRCIEEAENRREAEEKVH